MSCSICNKDFKRLTQHLKIKHGLEDRIVEPVSLYEFLKLIDLVPSKKFIFQNRRLINDHLNNGKDIPSNIYKELNKCFLSYTHNKGVKIVAQVGRKRLYHRGGKQSTGPTQKKLNQSNTQENKKDARSLLLKNDESDGVHSHSNHDTENIDC